MSKTLSVVIPVYNGEKFIQKTLDCIKNQSFQDFELILINDGSIDNTATILEDYKKNHNNTMIIHQKNTGQGIARNIGIKEASGKYLLLLDADDLYEKNFFLSMLENAKKTNADITICKSDNFFSKTGLKCLSDINENKFFPAQSVFFAFDMSNYIFNFSEGWAWDKLYKTEFVKKNSLFFPDLPHSEDLVFVYGAYCYNPKIAIVDETLVHHRMRNNSVSTSREKNPLAFIDATKMLKDIMIKTNTFEIYKQSFVNWLHVFFKWHYETVNNKNIVSRGIKSYLGSEKLLKIPRKYFYNKEIFEDSKLIYLKKFSFSLIPFSHCCGRYKFFGITVIKTKKKDGKLKIYLCGIHCLSIKVS